MTTKTSKTLDAVATMGTILDDSVGGRDAVHVAVFSATCKEIIEPGEPLMLVSRNGRDYEVKAAWRTNENAIAIADPFLTDYAEPGQRFWAYLYPRTITSLTHQWSHPEFNEKELPPGAGIIQTVGTSSFETEKEFQARIETYAAKISAEIWLKNYHKQICSQYDVDPVSVDYGDGYKTGFSFQDLITLATERADAITSDQFSESLYIRDEVINADIPPEFWDHIETFLGRKVRGYKATHFRCSC